MERGSSIVRSASSRPAPSYPLSSHANDSASAQEPSSLAGVGPPKALRGAGDPGGGRCDPRGRRRRLGVERAGGYPPARPAQAGRGGVELGGLRGRWQPPRVRPIGHHPSAGARPEDPPSPRARDGGDRGRALLRARRDRLRGDRPRGMGGPEGGTGRAGRLDDHPAARSQSLHRESRGDAGAKSPRGHLGGGLRGEVLEAPDPHEVPEHGFLRDDRRPYGGRRRRPPPRPTSRSRCRSSTCRRRR